MDTNSLLKKYSKALICDPAQVQYQVNYGLDDIKRIVPHRDPFLLIDKIAGVDLERSLIVGTREIVATDPVFQGHFPEYPVYPGTLLVEMMGQLGVASCYFFTEKDWRIKPGAKPVLMRATRIMGAQFIAPVLPGQRVVLLGQMIEWDGLLASMLGQVVVDGKVCCVSIGEVCM